jgi:PAS domain S-box-containing protein
MVTLQDLKQTLSLRSVQLSAAENHVLIQRAAREMAARSIPGTVIVPLCFILVVLVSENFFRSPFIWGSLSLVMLSSAIARRLAIRYLKDPELGSFSRWVQVFYWSCLGMAAVWGITTTIFIYDDLEGFPVLLILILSAGIGAGCMVNFCIWRALAVPYLLLSFVPPILLLIGVFPQHVTHWPILAAMVFFVVYLLLQTKQWNFHFWDALITAYLFERQAERLTATNSRLAEIIAREQQMRREVEKAREKTLELFNLTSEAIVICTLEGRVLDVNQAVMEMFTADRAHIVNTLIGPRLAMPTDSTLTFQDHWENAVNGEEGDFECRVTRLKEHGALLVHVNLRRVTWQEEQIIFVTLRDITAGKQLEETLEITQKTLSESEGYLQAILRNIDLPIYCKDLQGCYLTANRPFAELCCSPLGELLGKKDLQIFPEKIARFLACRDAEVIETGASIEIEGTFVFGDQEKKLLLHKFPLKESDGRIYAISGICTDETTMQGALRAAQLANEAKSEFLAGMSHELRTPMHSILSVARLGLRRVRGASREKLETYFQMIVTSGDQLLELLNDLLDLSTLESGGDFYNRQQHDLTEDLEKVVAEFRVMMEEREVSLCYQPPGCHAPAEYDRTKLSQVLRNLLANAMKFSARHKEVKILLEKDYLKLDGMRKSAWKVTVIDQGVGIEKNELEAVFGKFIKGSKTYPGAGGVGLGLSICQRIIEDHHGIIWAEQNDPEGAVFCFLLPALD